MVIKAAEWNKLSNHQRVNRVSQNSYKSDPSLFTGSKNVYRLEVVISVNVFSVNGIDGSEYLHSNDSINKEQ